MVPAGRSHILRPCSDTAVAELATGSIYDSSLSGLCVRERLRGAIFFPVVGAAQVRFCFAKLRHAAAAQTAAASRPLILAAAACMIRPGGSPSLSLNSRRAQYMTPPQAGFVPVKNSRRLFLLLMVARKRHECLSRKIDRSCRPDSSADSAAQRTHLYKERIANDLAMRL